MAITTFREFVDKIEGGVVREIGELPQMRKVAWAGSKTEFVVGNDCPLDVYSRVVGLFGGDTEFRAYTMPKAPPEPRPDTWLARPPSRISLTRASSSYSVEEMNLDTLADEIIDEWNQVAEGVSSAEVEREAIAEWLDGLEAAQEPQTLAAMIRAGDHLEGDDEPDEEEDDEPESTPEAAGGVTVATAVVEPPASP